MGIGHNMKKMTSVMYAEREKDVRNGRRMSGTGEGCRLRGTCHPRHGRRALKKPLNIA